MRRKRWMLLSAAPFLALLGSPTGVDALCMACSRSRPICERANYSGCQATQIAPDGSGFCDEWAANCAWVLNLSDIAADGSLALATTGELEADAVKGDAALRGCHGLIVEREYSERSVARLRAESKSLKV